VLKKPKQEVLLDQFCLHLAKWSISSPKGLLGIPVQFLIIAIILSTNHMAVASVHLGVWSWSRQSPELQNNHKPTITNKPCQNEKEM